MAIATPHARNYLGQFAKGEESEDHA